MSKTPRLTRKVLHHTTDAEIDRVGSLWMVITAKSSGRNALTGTESKCQIKA